MSQTEDHLLSLALSDEVFIAFNRWVPVSDEEHA
jgi:hypothetical protein